MNRLGAETAASAEDWERRADEALASIFAIEALHEAIKDRLSKGTSDGHLITLAELCREQFPRLRRALYGEGMEP